MSIDNTTEVTELFDRVKSLSDTDRYTLVRKILDSLPMRKPTSEPNRRGRSAAEIREEFRSEKPAPDDETVHRWIAEHRDEKYG